MKKKKLTFFLFSGIVYRYKVVFFLRPICYSQHISPSELPTTDSNLLLAVFRQTCNRWFVDFYFRFLLLHLTHRCEDPSCWELLVKCRLFTQRTQHSWGKSAHRCSPARVAQPIPMKPTLTTALYHRCWFKGVLEQACTDHTVGMKCRK